MSDNSIILKKCFDHLLYRYTGDPVLIGKLWTEMEQHYSESSRHYHTFTHLEQMLERLHEVKDRICSWDTVLFSLFYHDIVYDPGRSDNEVQSAQLALKRLTEISVPGNMISACNAQIMATKTHSISEEQDTNYFTDADLSILGQSREKYTDYSRRIRKEYAIYPDVLYQAGRSKVLIRFLEMEKIFKTGHFYHALEDQARKNITFELEQLSQ